ncbi:hypothetical protein D3C86_1284920 [compost metagenome]
MNRAIGMAASIKSLAAERLQAPKASGSERPSALMRGNSELIRARAIMVRGSTSIPTARYWPAASSPPQLAIRMTSRLVYSTVKATSRPNGKACFRRPFWSERRGTARSVSGRMCRTNSTALTSTFTALLKTSQAKYAHRFGGKKAR